VGKTGSKTLLKSCWKLAETTPFYRVTKTSRWGSIPRPDDLSVDRPVDRPTVIFQTVGVAGQPPSRPHPGHWLIGRPKLEPGRPSSRLGPHPESKLSGSVDRPVDWPSSLGLCTLLCTLV